MSGERKKDPVDMLDENADGQQNGCGHNIWSQGHVMGTCLLTIILT